MVEGDCEKSSLSPRNASVCPVNFAQSRADHRDGDRIYTYDDIYYIRKL